MNTICAAPPRGAPSRPHASSAPRRQLGVLERARAAAAAAARAPGRPRRAAARPRRRARAGGRSRCHPLGLAAAAAAIATAYPHPHTHVRARARTGAATRYVTATEHPYPLAVPSKCIFVRSFIHIHVVCTHGRPRGRACASRGAARWGREGRRPAGGRPPQLGSPAAGAGDLVARAGGLHEGLVGGPSGGRKVTSQNARCVRLRPACGDRARARPTPRAAPRASSRRAAVGKRACAPCWRGSAPRGGSKLLPRGLDLGRRGSQAVLSCGRASASGAAGAGHRSDVIASRRLCRGPVAPTAAQRRRRRQRRHLPRLWPRLQRRTRAGSAWKIGARRGLHGTLQAAQASAMSAGRIVASRTSRRKGAVALLGPPPRRQSHCWPLSRSIPAARIQPARRPRRR